MKPAEKIPEKLRMIILRPLALFSFAFYVLSCLLFNIGGGVLFPAAVLCSAVSVLFFVLYLIFGKSTKKKALFFALFMLFAGFSLSMFTNYGNFKRNIEPYSVYDGETVKVCGTVTDIISEEPYGTYFKTEIESIDKEEASVKMVLYADTGLSPGDKFTCDTAISVLFNENGAPASAIDADDFSEGIILSGEAKKADFVGTDSSLSLSAAKFRRKLSRTLIGELGEDCGGFCSALLLGERSNLPDRVHRDYKRIGVSHILAISGMHLAVICMIIQLILRRFHVRVRRAATTLTVIGYMILTGFPASVTRSGIMMLILILCQSSKKSSDMVTSIGLAVFLICISDPFSAGDIGLKLSAASVFAIALCTGQLVKTELKPLKRRPPAVRRALNYVGQSIFVGVSVVVFLLPLQWRYFGYISPISPIASVILSLLSSLILYLIPVLLLLSLLGVLVNIAAYPIKALCRICFLISAKLSEIPGICVSISFGGAFFLCIAAVILFVVWALSKKKTRLISGILCISVFIGLIGTSYALRITNTADITLINDKKNDAVVVNCGDKAAIIDIGNGYSPVLTAAMQKATDDGAMEIDYIVLTHLHKSHKNTLSSLFDRYMIRHLVIPDTALESEDDRELCYSLKELCLEKRVEFETPSESEDITLSKNTFLRIYKNSYIKRSVQPSVRLDIYSSDRTVTYIGSSYTEIHQNISFDCDVLLIGSHGPLYKKDFSANTDKVSHIIATEYASEYLPFKAKEGCRVHIENGGIVISE